ncbi:MULTISPECIES: DUF2254 domain-containing protein [Bacillus]|uniref:DUF2254 domain-containing protein n=1 Tax=Bacillus TaxID=1386 RepID=UPI000BB95653|nr:MULTISPECIES: DUF2254 domain-containing protein [Bacillus]
MKKVLLRMKESIWVIPSIYCTISFVLTLVVLYVDMVHSDFLQNKIPILLMTSVDLAQIILGTISAALLTMTTITFSTIMVVLTTYTSQFSPRTLKDFVTKSSTMRVLGVFLGAFIYSIVTLLFMRKGTIDHPVISASVGVTVAIISLAFFAYFIHNVATSIQVSNLIYQLTEDALKTIKDEERDIENANKEKKDQPIEPPERFTSVHAVNGGTFGYIQLMDYKKLYELAEEKDYYIELKEYIGHYVSKESVILHIFHKEKELKFEIDDYITIGQERTPIQDIEFNIIKMVEIALRAISPGINDPNTAIDCIRFLRTPLTEALQRASNYEVFYNKDKTPRLLKKQESVEQLLYTTFYQLSHYGRQDISILLAVMDTLDHIAEHSKQEVKVEVIKFAQYVYRKFEEDLLEELDKKHLDSKMEKFKVTIP